MGKYLLLSIDGSCQPYSTTAFYLQEDSWYSFLLEAYSTLGHSDGSKD
jgi:hypothetical protein